MKGAASVGGLTKVSAMKKWPLALTLPLVGFGAGFLIGWAFGDIGVAARGGAVRVPTAIFLAIAVALVGYFIGRAKDRATLKGANLQNQKGPLKKNEG